MALETLVQAIAFTQFAHLFSGTMVGVMSYTLWSAGEISQKRKGFGINFLNEGFVPSVLNILRLSKGSAHLRIKL